MEAHEGVRTSNRAEDGGYVLRSWDHRVERGKESTPAVQETWVQSLGREDPLEEGMATRSSILAWRDRGA